MATLVFDGTTNSLSPTVTATFQNAAAFYIEVPGVVYPNFVEFDFYLAAWVSITETRLVELPTTVVRTSELFPLPEDLAGLDLQIGVTAETAIQLKVWIVEAVASGGTVDLSPIQAQLSSIEAKIDAAPSTTVDLSPIQTKLSSIETKIDALTIANTQLPADIAQLQRWSTFWFDANDLASAGENAILSSWQDKNGRSITGANALRVQVVNGKYVAYFATDKWMNRPETQNDFNYVDLFVVLKHIQNGFTLSLGDSISTVPGSSNQVLALYVPYSYGHVFQDQHSYQIAGYSPSRWTYGQWNIIHLRYQAGTVNSEISDGYSYVTNSRSGQHAYWQIPVVSDALVLGGIPWWSWWEGQIQKFIAFLSRDKFLLNETERNLIKSYLIGDKP